jgi:hypothetical protein
MSSESIEQGDDRQQQHVENQSAEATQLSVRRKRNLVLQELALAVGTVQRINTVLRDIDALLTASEEEEEEEEEEGGDRDGAQRMVVDRGEEGPRRHVGVAAAISARAAAAAAYARAPLAAASDAAATAHPRKRARDAAAADDTRKLPASQARSSLVKQMLLLEELQRWNDS